MIVLSVMSLLLSVLRSILCLFLFRWGFSPVIAHPSVSFVGFVYIWSHWDFVRSELLTVVIDTLGELGQLGRVLKWLGEVLSA